MPSQLTPDLCVIGAGSGGLSVAAAAAAFGVPVVLIERGKMGGDCLNYGCVPSKALVAAARHAHTLGDAGRFGVTAEGTTVDHSAVRAHIDGVIKAIAPNDSKARFGGLGVQVIEGAATFKNKRTVVVGDAYEIRARRFVIATGSAPAIPPIPGLADVPYLTNETIFELTQRPEHLIVIGAGPIGLELAQAHRRLGAAVTVLEAAKPLAKEDPEAAAIVLDQLARDGVVLHAGVTIVRIETVKSAIRVVLDGDRGTEKVVEGSHLLVAAGRHANVEGLGLEAARVGFERNGIRVNKGLKTSNRRVYAIGDVVLGGPQFTHVANYHAGLVIRNALFRLRVNTAEGVIPRVTYTAPELAHVGLDEDAARKHSGAIRVLRWPFHENDRAQTERETHGHVKVITSAKGHILGATIVGSQAGELITPWTLAIGQKLKVGALLGLIIPYPTLSEAGKRAATSYYLPGLTSPWLRRMIGMLRWFG